MLWQPALPDIYLKLSPDALAAAITARRRELGDSLFILGHHYQTDDVIRHADATGDSLKLSQIAADISSQRPVKYVIFCGVHFMAESADMLTPEHVQVILPDLSAGCSMADMAQYDDTLEAWDAIHKALSAQPGGFNGRVIPITYVNSSAAIKAFVGAHGGACCTSSNAQRVFRWALAQGGTGLQPVPNNPDQPTHTKTQAASLGHQDIRILFLPDQHLGRNTACKFGLDPTRDMALYDPRRARAGEDLGGSTLDQIQRSKVFLWAGHCSVHKLFRPEHCDQIRAEDAANPGRPSTTILVHPECAKEVVDKADMQGSTEFIIKTLRSAPPNSRWAVGTEVHLVNRLAREAAARPADKGGPIHVRILSDCQCLCTTMYRIDEPHLLWVLDNLAGVEAEADGSERGGRREPPHDQPSSPASSTLAHTPRFADLTRLPGKPRIVNQIKVHPDVRRDALLALHRMLDQAETLAMVD